MLIEIKLYKYLIKFFNNKVRGIVFISFGDSRFVKRIDFVTEIIPYWTRARK